MVNVDIMQDASEVVHYDKAGIPLYIRQGLLSYYPEKRALCHWHTDFELIHVLEGEMNYSVNGETMFLTPGDSLFVASRQMHFGYHNEEKDCQFYCILFHPELLGGNPRFYQEYVVPLMQGPSYLRLHEAEMGTLMESIWREKNENLPGYELGVLGDLSKILFLLFQKSAGVKPQRGEPEELKVLRDMVSFVSQNYFEALSLNQIAAAGNVSRSKCCQLFGKYLGQTPVEFQNDYRLEVSRERLISTSHSVSEIAFSCGFNHLSYFSKLFAQKYGRTPREYRNMQKSTAAS